MAIVIPRVAHASGMQRRAAAIYVAFFLIVGAASYSLIATATAPTVEFDNPEYQLGQDDSFTLGGTEYTVADISAGYEGGGHGSAPELVREGTLSWTNESARYTVTWEQNDTVSYRGIDWRVLTDTDSEPSEVVLEEELNRTAILQEDPNADNELVTRQGEDYVAVTEDNTTRLVPVADYFPTPEVISYAEGEQLKTDGNQTTIASVSGDAAVLEWTAPRKNTMTLADRQNVTIQDQTYLAMFPDNSTVVMTQDFESFRTQQSEIERFETQKNGLWGISVVSGLTVILLAAMAYLPSRY